MKHSDSYRWVSLHIDTAPQCDEFDQEKTKTAKITMTEPCPPGKIRNPKTMRCIKKPVPLVKRPCEKGKVRNPKTGRCITQKASSIKQIKVCPEGKILNPKTNRCVNVDGWAGKQLVQ